MMIIGCNIWMICFELYTPFHFSRTLPLTSYIFILISSPSSFLTLHPLAWPYPSLPLSALSPFLSQNFSFFLQTFPLFTSQHVLDISFPSLLNPTHNISYPFLPHISPHFLLHILNPLPLLPTPFPQISSFHFQHISSFLILNTVYISPLSLYFLSYS